MEHYCDSCKHNGVCKYKEEFEAKRKEIKDLVENVKTEDNPVIVDIKCKYYLDSIGTLTFPGRRILDLDLKPPYVYNGDPIPINYTKSTNPCEGCPNNPALSDIPIVGDSPCEWCQHSPTRVTCRTNDNKVK